MSSFFTFFFLEWKKSLRLMKKMMVSICLLFILMTAGIVLATFAMTQANTLAKVSVAILIPTDENETRVAVQLASTLDSIQSICEIRYYEVEKNAINDLKNGDVQACIVFPDHFYEDADNGTNTPATVYFSNQLGLSERLFRGVLCDGVSLLQTAEAGIYTVLDETGQYPVGMDEAQIADLMLNMYIEQLFSGGQLFDKTMVSPLDSYDLAEYVFCGILLMTILLPGLSFGFFYRAGQRSLEQKLRLLGIGAWKLSLIRVLVMTQMLWISFLSVYAVGCAATAFGWCTVAYWDVGTAAGTFPLCVALACVFHGLYTCSGSVRTGTVLVLLIELWFVMGSGMLIPVDFLPEGMQWLCEHLHMNVWSSYLLKLLYQEFDPEMLCIIGSYAMLLFGVGVFGLWKHTSSGGRYS